MNDMIACSLPDEKAVMVALAEAFHFRKDITFLGMGNHNYVFYIDFAIMNSEKKSKQKVNEFVSEIRFSDIPDEVTASYKDPWKKHGSETIKSIHLTEESETYWNYRIYFIDGDSRVHKFITQQPAEKYYELLMLKIQFLSKIIKRYFVLDDDMLSLEKALTKKYKRK